MDAPEDHHEMFSRPLPNKFRRGLNAQFVNYPGCERDLFAAREAIEMGSKREFLKVFRVLKGKQVAHEHYTEMKGPDNTKIDELDYPGKEADKRELQTWFHENPPNEKNVRIFRERVEGLRNKNAVMRGDRSHPNIAALLKLKLSYPDCEKDVQEALQVHYSRPRTKFPDVLHALNVKQDVHINDRSHWRLVKLDDLDLTYPNWKRDFDAVEDWHMNKTENRENDVLFHEILEGVLEKEALYLDWVQQQGFPGLNRVEANCQQKRFPGLDRVELNCRDGSDTGESRYQSSTDEEEDYSTSDDDIYMAKKGMGVRMSPEFEEYFVDAREVQGMRVSKQTRSSKSHSDWDDEDREPEPVYDRS